ncbi:phage major capsid protein [Cupriavidus gilardii]|uniref:phage major capsid protein n=1 Tax=Cupriavidus gilardii TaxID=82541 RepID=UPI0021B25526|nr:phage major capsid protein [Cupriavidus gilardii]UXC37186.1 phage major capsid protein [Cupriavidus gilardii]
MSHNHNPLYAGIRSGLQRKNAGELADDQIELKGVLDALAKRDAEIKGFVEKANAEIAETGKIAADTKSALELLAKDGNSLQARVLELEQKLARGIGGEDGDNGRKSYGEQFTDSDDFQALVTKGRGIARMAFKAVTDITSITTGTGGVGAGIQPMRLPGVVRGPDRPFTIRDLLMPGRTGSNAIEYVQERGFQNSAAPVAEGTLKPQSDLSLELKTTTVKTIAHWFRASKQVLADLPLLQSYINGRAIYGLKYVEEDQLLAGDGTGENLLGILPQATAFNDALRKAGDTPIDTLRRAILQVRVAEYRATGIVLNPVDWAELELQKDSTGAYIWVNVQEGGTQRMWRLPVVDTNAMPQGEFLVGAFDMGAQVFDREDAAVEVSTEDGDNFRRNMVTIRAEERLALAVYRPESFVHGEFAAPVTP